MIWIKFYILAQTGQLQITSIKMALAYIAIRSAICRLQSLSSSFVFPHPILEFCDHLVLLFKDFDCFSVVDNVFFAIIIASVFYGYSPHIQHFFKKGEHIHALCAPLLILLLFILTMPICMSKSVFLWDPPFSRLLVVLHCIFFCVILLYVGWCCAKQM